MKKYQVTISHISKTTVEINANSRDEAEEIAASGVLNNEYELDSGLYLDNVKFTVKEIKDREPER